MGGGPSRSFLPTFLKLENIQQEKGTLCFFLDGSQHFNSLREWMVFSLDALHGIPHLTHLKWGRSFFTVLSSSSYNTNGSIWVCGSTGSYVDSLKPSEYVEPVNPCEYVVSVDLSMWIKWIHLSMWIQGQSIWVCGLSGSYVDPTDPCEYVDQVDPCEYVDPPDPMWICWIHLSMWISSVGSIWVCGLSGSYVDPTDPCEYVEWADPM